MALDEKFYAYGEELERVEVFQYLGRLIAFDDDDTQAVRRNLAKARRFWARISRVLRAENASARVYGMFYKAAVSTVFVFGDTQDPPTFFGSKLVILRTVFTWKPSSRCNVAGDRTHVLLPKRRTGCTVVL